MKRMLNKNKVLASTMIAMSILMTGCTSSEENATEIDGHRIDIPLMGGVKVSYKLSSIDSVKSTGTEDETVYYMRINRQNHVIDKKTYEEILDYMEDSK